MNRRPKPRRQRLLVRGGSLLCCLASVDGFAQTAVRTVTTGPNYHANSQAPGDFVKSGAVATLGIGPACVDGSCRGNPVPGGPGADAAPVAGATVTDTPADNR
jgi:hypothetical protein